jgi:hypothetical protein
MKELDELLNGEEATDIAQPVEAETPPQPVEAEPAPARDEQGRFAPKGVDDGVPPAPADKLPQDDFKALKDERTKRQNLERELAELRQAAEAQRNPPPPPPSIWEDEQGWQQSFGSEVVSTAVQQATANAKLDMSEMLARQANPDFDEMKAEFLALAQQSPQLAQQALADPHPWDRAYKIAKTQRTMAELGTTDIDGLKAKLREEIMAEMGQQQAPYQAAAPAIPVSLSGERSVASRGGPVWTGPKSLDALLR